jgi:hypothetical protein
MLKVSASGPELWTVNIAPMKSIKSVAMPAALIVFVICIYAFLLGNKVFEGKFENEAIAWYILAKGIFCSVALVALSRILDGIIAKLGG